MVARRNGELKVGWRVGTFALDCLEPDENGQVGSSDIWSRYQAWCESQKAVPLAYGVFYAEFERLAFEVSIGRRQVGAHVTYHGLAFKAGKDA